MKRQRGNVTLFEDHMAPQNVPPAWREIYNHEFQLLLPWIRSQNIKPERAYEFVILAVREKFIRRRIASVEQHARWVMGGKEFEQRINKIEMERKVPPEHGGLAWEMPLLPLNDEQWAEPAGVIRNPQLRRFRDHLRSV